MLLRYPGRMNPDRRARTAESESDSSQTSIANVQIYSQSNLQHANPANLAPDSLPAIPLPSDLYSPAPMEAKEVELRGKALMKAVAGGEPSANIAKLLNELKNGVKATEELLRSTRIGVTVNKCKQHKDPEVARLAAELVSKWRTDVKRAGGASTPKPANGTVSPASSTTTSANAPVKAKAKHNVAPENRNHKTDKVDYQVTGVLIRDNCVKLMYDGLAHMSEERKPPAPVWASSCAY